MLDLAQKVKRLLVWVVPVNWPEGQCQWKGPASLLRVLVKPGSLDFFRHFSPKSTCSAGLKSCNNGKRRRIRWLLAMVGS